jgi:hypothetical protein
MSQENENVIRRALDAVDRHRRRLYWLLAIVSVTVAWEFYRLGSMRPGGDVPGMILAAAVALAFWTLALAVVLVFQLTGSSPRTFDF